MNHEQIIDFLKDCESEFRDSGVGGYLFGSVARDQAIAQSDVDVFLDFEKPQGLLYSRLRTSRSNAGDPTMAANYRNAQFSRT